MDCPFCENAMITLELADIEIDYCGECEGIWLDAGELELLLGGQPQAKGLIDSFKTEKNSTEKPRKCPICSKKMQKIIVGSVEPKLLIDRCPKADGLWFDRGELKNILEAGSFDEENKVANLLKDMFPD